MDTVASGGVRYAARVRLRPCLRLRAAFGWLLLPLLFATFGRAQAPLPKDELGEIYPRHNVLGLGRPHAPRSNVLTYSGFTLGRRLFFDPILSANHSMSCASCHRPEHGFSSPDGPPIGADGERCEFDAATLYNRMWAPRQGWLGQSESIEQQAQSCLESPEGLDLPIGDAAARLQEDAGWHYDFELLYAEGPTEENVTRALSCFIRGLMLGDLAVDRFQHGEPDALDRDERQGLWLFMGKASCWQCHTGNNFTDEEFHDTGIGVRYGIPEDGRYLLTGKETDRGAFKTPTLRGVANTAPYMHDGSLPTLADVVEYYRAGGNHNPWLDSRIMPLDLSDEEAAELVAFLKALSKP